MNKHLPVGTPIVKIYAIEKLAMVNKELARGEWDYIMTKDGVSIRRQGNKRR